MTLAKRDWLLQSLLQLRSLAPGCDQVARRSGILSDEFRDEFYARNRPVVIEGLLADWPALERWKPGYLLDRVGAKTLVEYQGGRNSSGNFELYKDDHKVIGPFGTFMSRAIGLGGNGANDVYITAYNSGTNRDAFAVLDSDLGHIEKLLTEGPGMLWIGGAGTFTPLHHDLTNNLLVQVTGTKEVVLVPPEETPRMHNDTHVFSRLHDLARVSPKRFPQAADITRYRVELRAGDALFLPLGWWHQVLGKSFSVSLTYTNFLWRNDFHASYPNG